MIKWKEEIIIEAMLEDVWTLFHDKNIKRIMPKVEEHLIIEKKENEVGAKHRQTYREGKRLETYVVETIEYIDQENEKRKKIRFVLGKAFEITLVFSLSRVDNTKTKFIYEGQNKGVNFVGRAMLKLGSEKSNHKVVEEFIMRVNQEALKEQ